MENARTDHAACKVEYRSMCNLTPNRILWSTSKEKKNERIPTTLNIQFRAVWHRHKSKRCRSGSAVLLVKTRTSTCRSIQRLTWPGRPSRRSCCQPPRGIHLANGRNPAHVLQCRRRQARCPESPRAPSSPLALSLCAFSPPLRVRQAVAKQHGSRGSNDLQSYTSGTGSSAVHENKGNDS